MQPITSKLHSLVDVDKQAFAFYVMNFFVNLGIGIMAPVLPELKAYFGVSYGEIGFVVSAFGLSRLLLDLPVGWASERIRPGLIMLFGTFLITAGSLYAGMSSTFIEIVAARAVMGAGSAMCATTAMIVLSHLSTPQNRAKMFSLFPVGGFAGASLSPLIGGYMAAIFDWRAAFYFCGASAFASLVFVALTQRKRQPSTASGYTSQKASAHHIVGKPGKADSDQPGDAPAQAANGRVLFALMGVAFFVYFSRQGLSNALIPLYAKSALGLDVEVIGTMISLYAVLTLFTLFPSGFLADRYGRMLVFIPGMGLLALSTLLMPFTQNQLQLLAVVAIAGLSGLTVSIPGVLVGDLSQSKNLTRTMGTYRFVVDFGIFAGPVVLSTLIDFFGFGVPALLDAALLVISTACVLLLLPTSPVARFALARSKGSRK